MMLAALALLVAFLLGAMAGVCVVVALFHYYVWERYPEIGRTVADVFERENARLERERGRREGP